MRGQCCLQPLVLRHQYTPVSLPLYVTRAAVILDPFVASLSILAEINYLNLDSFTI